MIITKTPLRISFAGGGTDLPSFYEREDYGAVVSATIDKYVYLAVHPYFEGKFLLKYSRSELVGSPKDIRHPLIREALLMAGTKTPLEITSFADIPASGSGLGSSSAFCVGLLNALALSDGRVISNPKLAEMACNVEIRRLKEPIGKQDQYACAVGGLNYVQFNKDDSVFVDPIPLSPPVRQTLEECLLLFFTGLVRSSRSILTKQNRATNRDEKVRDTLLEMRDLAAELRASLLRGDLGRFGEILHEGWLLKRRLGNGVSNGPIDAWYAKAMRAGAVGGKLLGAGGGGFLLFCVPKDRQPAVRKALRGLREVPFSLDFQGTRIAHYD